MDPTDAILDAIARIKVADRRLRLAHSLVDDVGVQMAYQAVLHNLSVISEAVRSIPPDVLECDPATAWNEIADLPVTMGGNYLRVDPDAIHRMVESQLEPLEIAVRRIRSSQAGR